MVGQEDLIKNTSIIDGSLVVVSSQGKRFYRYYFILFLYQIDLFLIVHLIISATINQLMNFQISLISISSYSLFSCLFGNFKSFIGHNSKEEHRN